MAIKTVRLAAWLLDQVRKSRRLAELHIDDDVALALKILRAALLRRKDLVGSAYSHWARSNDRFVGRS